ncbi:MAG: hypothetical protein EOO30_00665 [Comamonadaceae bacterium]|nr:MAG: hypothetical protein EOO30_00665 [Comamonadaceae bacterium]
MARLPTHKSPARSGDLDRPWQAGDTIPAPEVEHRDGDSAWALWTQVSRQHEARFQPTAPLTLPPGMGTEEAAWARTQPAFGASPLRSTRRAAQPLFTLESALLLARRNNRVCPRPQRWEAFCELLPPRKTVRGTARPPAPPTGAAWGVTPALTKRLCFREQLEWAEREGVLEAVFAFMQSLAEEEWLHMGED